MPFKNRRAEGPVKQEKRLAEDHRQGKLVPNSGRIPGMPGDVSFPEHLLDAKLAEASFTVNRGVLLKITREAHSKGKRPVVQLDLESMPIGNKRWAIIPWDEFLEGIGENHD